MLQLLRVTNFALIDHLELDFSSGLNLLTGETGSGKSIIIDALGLVLGDRASAEMIRTGCEAAHVEALFSASQIPGFNQLLNYYGINAYENELIIRREISNQGRSRILLNNSLSILQTLKVLGAELVDVQTQGEQRSLQGVESHRRYLDEYAGNQELLAKVYDRHAQLCEIEEKRKRLRMSEQERLRRLDLLRYQTREIDDIAPHLEEDKELEDSRRKLANAARLKQLAASGYDLIYEQEGGLLELGRQLLDHLGKLRDIDPAVAVHFDQLSNLRYTLEDTAYFLRDYVQSLDFEPESLERVDNRLANLDRLKRKHGGSIAEVLRCREEFVREIENLELHEENEARLSKQLQELYGEYVDHARLLTESRRHSGKELEKHLARELRDLAMDKVRFRVDIETCLTSEEAAGIENCYKHGLDAIEFLVAVNPGEELKSLSRTASGGELSRIHLALRNALKAEWTDRTVIFDEVDSGVGGKVAGLLGSKLKQLSKRNQVICITHLPQIAVFADRHFHVYKKTQGGRTTTHIEVLEGERRVEEIARMLGGNTITETTLKHAREILRVPS